MLHLFFGEYYDYAMHFFGFIILPIIISSSAAVQQPFYDLFHALLARSCLAAKTSYFKTKPRKLLVMSQFDSIFENFDLNRNLIDWILRQAQHFKIWNITGILLIQSNQSFVHN